MSNTNCLEGFKCPKCGNEEVFHIKCTTWFAVLDNGTEHNEGDVVWDDESPAHCPDCGHGEYAKDFRINNEPTRNQ